MAKAAQHKQRLIITAANLFRKKGYAATGLNEILAGSGAPKGSLYHYFPEGKDALGAAAVTAAGTVVAKTLAGLRAESDDAGQFINRYCELLAGWMEGSGFQSGCPIATTVLETCPNSAAIQQASKAVFESWITVIAHVFIDDGLDHAQAEASAELTIATIEGALILCRVQCSADPIRRIAKQIVPMVKLNVN
jgi:TetR/AcrR family transcriptional repressor of lmrAB and yxaGH operons